MRPERQWAGGLNWEAREPDLTEKAIHSAVATMLAGPSHPQHDVATELPEAEGV